MSFAPSAADPQPPRPQPRAQSPIVMYLQTLPVATRTCLVLNVALFLSTFLGMIRLGSVCSMPVRVIRYFEIWRVFTPAWFHAGVLHIAMNMSTFVGMGPGLERQWGSLCFLLLLMVFATAGSATGLLPSVALSTSGVSPGAMWECGIGFSGVLFSLLVLLVEAQGGSQS